MWFRGNEEKSDHLWQFFKAVIDFSIYTWVIVTTWFFYKTLFIKYMSGVLLKTLQQSCFLSLIKSCVSHSSRLCTNKAFKEQFLLSKKFTVEWSSPQIWIVCQFGWAKLWCCNVPVFYCCIETCEQRKGRSFISFEFCRSEICATLRSLCRISQVEAEVEQMLEKWGAFPLGKRREVIPGMRKNLMCEDRRGRKGSRSAGYLSSRVKGCSLKCTWLVINRIGLCMLCWGIWTSSCSSHRRIYEWLC